MSDNGAVRNEGRVGSQSALQRQEMARGILLLFVFYIHALYVFVDHAGGPLTSPLASFQNRLLAAQVALFFVFAGQSARKIGMRHLAPTVSRSLSLLLLAEISHLPVALALDLARIGEVTPRQFLQDLFTPLILGTGYLTSMPWFFVVLASTRMLAYVFTRSKAWFALWLLLIAAAAWIADRSGVSDNLYEWRNLPVALPLFLAGMYLPAGWSPPAWLAALSVIGAPVIAFANSPDGIRRFCLSCDPEFVAQPFVGEMGSPILLFASLTFVYCLLAYVAAALVGSRLGKIIRPFGKNSLLLLLMHGWLLVSLYPAAIGLLPRRESWLFYAGFVAIIPPLHWGLFMLLKRPLSACYNLANWLSRNVVSVMVRIIARRRVNPAAL